MNKKQIGDIVQIASIATGIIVMLILLSKHPVFGGLLVASAIAYFVGRHIKSYSGK